MGQVTGQRGLRAIERTSGVEEATYALKVGHRYREAKGRVAETYRQLADGPMTGSELFADLDARNWLLPLARRKYRPGEFRAHLWWMVGEPSARADRRLRPNRRCTGPTATSQADQNRFKVTYNDGGARGGPSRLPGGSARTASWSTTYRSLRGLGAVTATTSAGGSATLGGAVGVRRRRATKASC